MTDKYLIKLLFFFISVCVAVMSISCSQTSDQKNDSDEYIQADDKENDADTMQADAVNENEVETDEDDVTDENDENYPDNDIDEEQEPIPGYNPTAFKFNGSMRDLDVVSGKIRAFGGTPLQLLECAVDGIDDVTCVTVADMPADAGEAVNYKYNGVGEISVAVAAAIPEENPIDVIFIDEDSGNIESHNQIEEVPMPGFSYTPTRPGGIASCYTSVLEYERTFISTANWLEFDDGYHFVQSTVLLFGDRSTDVKPIEGVGFSSGVNVTALAAIELEEGSELRPWLIGINAGSLDPFDERHAAIDFMDPEPVELHTIESVDLGAIELFALSEVKFNTDKSAIYLVAKAPAIEFVRIDLSTSEKLTLSIDPTMINEVTDIFVDEGLIYIANSNGTGKGSLIVVEESVNGDEIQLSTTYSYELNASPLSIVVIDGIVAIACDDEYLHLIDPSEIE